MCRSFKLDWSAFVKSDFPEQLKSKVNSFLSDAASKPGETASITGKMTLLDFGTEVRGFAQAPDGVLTRCGVQEPEVKLVDVHDLSTDEIRLSFAFCYEGSAETKFQLCAQV